MPAVMRPARAALLAEPGAARRRRVRARPGPACAARAAGRPGARRAGTAAIVSTPSRRTLYKDGPTGRYLLDGPWLFRPDPAGNGDLQGWQSRLDRGLVADDRAQRLERQRLEPVEHAPARRLVPQGLQRCRARPSGLRGSCASSPSTTARTVWLNGHLIGSTPAPTCPSSCACRAALKRSGVNRLVVRVDNRRDPTDFPPRASTRRASRPAAGGTTAASCARSTCAASTTSTSRPSRSSRPPCAHLRRDGARSAPRSATTTGRAARARHRHVRRAGVQRSARARSAPQALRHLHDALRVAKPRLWSPDRPHLYDLRLTASGGGVTLAELVTRDRHPLDQGRRRPPLPQRPAAGLPRRRPPRGRRGQGLRDRQRRAASGSSTASRSSARR